MMQKSDENLSDSLVTLDTDRVSTGIEDLDQILEGGFPRRSLILVAGNPGTGKTVLSTQFLYEGAVSQGEGGVYVSFAETRNDFLRNTLKLGMDMKSLEEKGFFKFMELITMEGPAMTKAVEMIMDTVLQSGAKRLVIDPISAVLQMFGQDETRIFLHTILGRLTKGHDITTILVGEIPIGKDGSEFGIEEFVVDGIILLKQHFERNMDRRELYIIKMRGTQLPRSSFTYLIDSKHGGIKIFKLPPRTEMKIAPTEKISTGVEGLDKMLHGGVFRNSITLIEGAGGIGKTTLCLQFLINNAEKGDRVLYISLDEPVSQIYRMLHNYGMDISKLGEKFHAESHVPEALMPLHFYAILNDVIEERRPSIIALDNISAIENILSGTVFDFMRYLQILCKERGVTAFLTCNAETIAESNNMNLSTLADNVIVMRYYELKDRLAKEILIVKTRGSECEKRIIPFEITEKGMIVHA